MNKLNDLRHAEAVYLTNCRADNLSPCTLENYAAHIGAYLDWCEQNESDPVSAAAVLGWKVALHDANLKNSSVAVYMRDVRLYFSWAVSSPICQVDTNPIELSMIPRVKRQPYDKLLSEGDILSVIAGEKRDDARRSHWWPRNNAMALLFLASALRVSELCAVTMEDLDWENSIIHVRHGKGDKIRFVPFPDFAQAAVEEYLDSGLRPDDLPDDFPLFVTTSKENPDWHGFDRNAATKIVNRHVKSITGREDIRAHALRHASASTMLIMDVPKEQIQAVLGHSSVQTTERYIGLLRPESAAVSVANTFSALGRRAQVREVG